MKLAKSIIVSTLLAAGLQLVLPNIANAALPKRTFCVWDVVGANGPMYSLMKATKPEALKWGVDLQLKAYTDEKIAAEDFKAGICDSVLLTSTRARKFNKFTGSLEALGAIQNRKEMKLIIETLSQPRAARLLVHGDVEVAGILPAGAVYLFLRDRNVDTVGELQGKKIATFDYDKAAMHMVRYVGASIVGSSSSNFAGKFNNGSVDIAYAPAVAFKPLELYKGLSHNGGIFDFTLAQLTFQILIHPSRFPKGYGQESREYALSKMDDAYKVIAKAEKSINPKLWIRPSPKDAAGYNAMFRSVRIALRNEGEYDGKALKLMRQVRCKENPAAAECAEKTE